MKNSPTKWSRRELLASASAGFAIPYLILPKRGQAETVVGQGEHIYEVLHQYPIARCFLVADYAQRGDRQSSESVRDSRGRFEKEGASCNLCL